MTTRIEPNVARPRRHRIGRSRTWRALFAPLLFIPLLFAALLCGPARALTPIPYQGEFREELDEIFFDTSAGTPGSVSPQKLATYREFIEKKRRVLEIHVVNSEVHEAGRSREEALERFQKLDTTVALDYTLDLIGELPDIEDPRSAYESAAEILMLEYATRSYTDGIGTVEVPIFLNNVMFEWRIENGPRPRKAHEEANNLLDPESGLFYTPEEIKQMMRAGFDLSTLEPPTQTHFWRAKENISKVDVVANYLKGGNPVHEGHEVRLPEYDGAVFTLKKTHLTQSKPKLDVYYMDAECRAQKRKKQKKCRQTLKLKFGMETHSDPTSNALLAALGYNNDISVHAKNIKLYLGDITLDELESDWAGYFDHQRLHTFIPLHTVRKEGAEGHGFDEGGEYIVFHEAAVEFKPDYLERIGFFPFSWGMAQTSREARGLFLFNAWIGNADMKDEENNKLILRRMEGGSLQMMLVQQDIGHSMGKVLPERPDSFGWDLVEQGWFSKLFGRMNRTIELNYTDLQNTGLQYTATFSDAKWMARKISQLTRPQIEAAVGMGDWPGGIPQLYVEKLINRRNQMVEAFRLADEIAMMVVDRNITTEDGTVAEGELTQSEFEESPIQYDNEWDDLLFPIFHFLADRVKQAIQVGASSIDVINPGDIHIEGKVSAYPRILIDVDRRVILNPKPQSKRDQYIVVDTIALGLRVGFGYVGNVEAGMIKRYTLAYPAPTLSEGIGKGFNIINFLLPYKVHRGQLPEGYVLVHEVALMKGFRVSTDQSNTFTGVGIDADQNWVLERRSIIDHRGENPIIYQDRPRSIERNVRVFIDAVVLQIPFMIFGSKSGHLDGKTWVLDHEKLDVPDPDHEGSSIFDRIVRRADFSKAAEIQLHPARRAHSDFNGFGTTWNLFFVNRNSRTSDEKITITDEAGDLIREERQLQKRSRFAWTFIDNGERMEFRVAGLLGSDPRINGGRPWEPVILAIYRIDDLNTHSDEFDRYFDMLVGLGAGESDLSPEFDARDWEVSKTKTGRWTRLLTTGTLRIHAEAQQRILEIDEDSYWRNLARQLGLGEREFARYREGMRSGRSKRSLQIRRTIPSLRIKKAIHRSFSTLAHLRRAKRSDDQVERLKHLVRMVYASGMKTGGSFDSLIIGTLLREAGAAELLRRNQLGVDVQITKAFEDENNLPKRRNVIGKLGAEDDLPNQDYRFFPFTNLDNYNRLDWVRALE